MPISYSNELGTAIREVAPGLGTALWAPSLMYIGADVYDKYKNDRDTVNPSTKRAFQEAVFLGVTNLITGPLLILAGQKIVSPLGRLFKPGISINAKDAIYRHTIDVIEQASPDTDFNTGEQFKKHVLDTFQNKIQNSKKEYQMSNFFKKILKHFAQDYSLVRAPEEKLEAYTAQNAEKVFNIIETNKIMKEKYQKLIPTMAAYPEGNAKKAIFQEYQNSRIFQNKLLKTLGGFVALGLFVSPVNRLIEKYFMKQVVEPGLEASNNFIQAHLRLKDKFLSEELPVYT